ncbi:MULTISPECIES: SanA/YdcF family protein [Zobellia]|uniref:Protein involved in barrier function of the cell envelope n=1 Tax=Zobellia galactanivorans (strain DSM 12802 / CCUG 47099 / CIP 106680 / NCIMB 13871 / Dsij) TaxID=63186 RepID=G0LC15_ZOBGA|nr:MULTISPECIES: ElyC/SanA/YdcF family protein [Zobellia]OWW27406.1 protein SanA [Zobellia sp. OII3]CAZ96567.1 Protein involved in barrier function of the cell envelope [Zobellia galactanivorans]
MRKNYYKICGALVASLFLLIFLCNLIISSSAEGKTFNSLEALPKNRVGIVLGTSKKLIGGLPNPYYTFRIEATLELYQAQKIDFVLVSGDNGTRYYNEPNTIKKDLISKGIPAEKIFLDFAGFRTLDSMVRAKEVFGLNDVTVISQEFHNQRAIYLAEKKGLKAIGYNAKSISGRQGLKVRLREYLARVKVFIDLLFNTQPKFFGERVDIK